jgi:hypothetical protein
MTDIRIKAVHLSGSYFPEHQHDATSPAGGPFAATVHLTVDGKVIMTHWSLGYAVDHLVCEPGFQAADLGIDESEMAALQDLAEAAIDEAWDDGDWSVEAGEGADNAPVTWSIPAFLSLNSSTS